MLALPHIFKAMPLACWRMMKQCGQVLCRNAAVLTYTCTQLFVFPHKVRILLVCVELNT